MLLLSNAERKLLPSRIRYLPDLLSSCKLGVCCPRTKNSNTHNQKIKKKHTLDGSGGQKTATPNEKEMMFTGGVGIGPRANVSARTLHFTMRRCLHAYIPCPKNATTCFSRCTGNILYLVLEQAQQALLAFSRHDLAHRLTFLREAKIIAVYYIRSRI